jgi:hypothetical protein
MIEPTATGTRAQAAKRFRKMALVTTALVGVGLLAATSFAFLQTNGSATTSITAGGTTGNEFADVQTSGTFTPGWAVKGTTSPTQPSSPWTPVVGQVVAVQSASDLAIVDATGTTGNVLVTLVLSNAAALSADYSYINLPIQVEVCTLNTTCTWNAEGTDANGDAIGNGGLTYLTLSNGYLSFLLKGGSYYELEIPTGGSFYTISTSATGGALSPNYLINVQSAG